MREIAATGCCHKSPRVTWKSLLLKSVAQIQPGLNSCDILQQQSKCKQPCHSVCTHLPIRQHFLDPSSLVIMFARNILSTAFIKFHENCRFCQIHNFCQLFMGLSEPLNWHLWENFHRNKNFAKFVKILNKISANLLFLSLPAFLNIQIWITSYILYIISLFTGRYELNLCGCRKKTFVTRKGLCTHWWSILRPPKHWIVFSFSILKPKAVIYPCYEWKQALENFRFSPQCTSCRREHVCWTFVSLNIFKNTRYKVITPLTNKALSEKRTSDWKLPCLSSRRYRCVEHQHQLYQVRKKFCAALKIISLWRWLVIYLRWDHLVYSQ